MTIKRRRTAGLALLTLGVVALGALALGASRASGQAVRYQSSSASTIEIVIRIGILVAGVGFVAMGALLLLNRRPRPQAPIEID